MISFGIAASSHSGLIPLKTAYKKRGELLWAIASKKNFINLHSAAFVTVFGRNLVLAYKFCIFKKNRSSKIALASSWVLVLLLVNYVYTSWSFPYKYVRWIVVDIDTQRKSTKIKVNPNNGVNNSNPITASNREKNQVKTVVKILASTKFKNIVIKFGAGSRKVTFSLVDYLKASGPCLVPVTFRARNQIFKSKYKERELRFWLANYSILFY